MDALILAAGLGSRLQSDRPKPLTLVAGEPLIDRTIGGLRRAGVARIVVVVGYEAEQIVGHLTERWPDVETVFNENFRLGNGVSVACARDVMPNDFILAMADHVVEDRIWEMAAAHEPRWDGITLLVDRRVAEVFDLDDATKVLVSPNGRLDKIGKQLSKYNAIDTGVFVSSPSIFSGIDAQMATAGDASLSDGVTTLIDFDTAESLDIGDAFWQDVDTPEMLAHAEARLGELKSHS
jgi:choline kinase